MLAGTGRGSSQCRISPAKEIVSMIRNCFKYFIFTPWKYEIDITNLIGPTHSCPLDSFFSFWLSHLKCSMKITMDAATAGIIR